MIRSIAALTAAVAVVGLGTPASAGPQLVLQGTIAGHYRELPRSNPDVGRSYRVSGHGHTSLGRTKATGKVRAPGFIAKGRCTARLHLSTSDGTAVVAVRSTHRYDGQSSCQSGFAFRWHTVQATGGYDGQSASGTGTLTLVRAKNASESPPPFYVTFDPAA